MQRHAAYLQACNLDLQSALLCLQTKVLVSVLNLHTRCSIRQHQNAVLLHHAQIHSSNALYGKMLVQPTGTPSTVENMPTDHTAQTMFLLATLTFMDVPPCLSACPVAHPSQMVPLQMQEWQPATAPILCSAELLMATHQPKEQLTHVVH